MERLLLTRPSRTRGARSGRRCGSGSKRRETGALTGAPIEHEDPECTRCRPDRPPAGPMPRPLLLALEDRASRLLVVDHEGERCAIAPAAEEQVAVDVDVGVGQGTGQTGHPAGPV